ncbi:MAG: L,D-transpeptidase family protein, partial [Planctomycetes bacterium]|nr:L,D-transpeptidase family protein [Planctomycetota bacterium]
VTEAALKYYHQGAAAMEKRDYLAARQLLSKAVKEGLNPSQEKNARDYINQASDQWLFSANVYDNDPLCSRYKVTAGDRLVAIAKRMGVPYKLLMRINKITDAKRLRAGESIKVVKGPFHAVVDRSDFQLSVYLGDILVRTYPVGLGTPGRQTPTGKWRVKIGKKQVNPAWTDVETNKHYYPDDPENPLGERWIGLEGLSGQAKGRVGFGIHGTINPEEIGSAASRGCIRLLNNDVIELYDMLEEELTEVLVVE